MKIAFITDSTSDIKPDLAAQMGATVVPLYVNFQDQVRKDGLEIHTHDIFEGVKAGAAMPSTSQPTPVDFAREFERLLQNHDHVISLHISSKLSGTYNSAELSARDFAGKITVMDSKVASASMIMMLERAQRLAAAGATLETIKATLEKVIGLTNLRFSVASLDYLKKNGRIGGAQALLGGLLGFKPILHLVDGKIEAAGRERGSRAALENVVKNLREYASKHGTVRASYVYTDKPEDVAAARAEGQKLGVEEFGVFQCGAVVSAHVGPGTYGVFTEPVDVAL
jgi:DegV family protein with EDD domain